MSVGEIWIYLGFFVTLVAAGLGLPAPEEIVVSGAGVLAGQAPDQPPDVEEVVLPSWAEVSALLAVSPEAGCPAALPWGALARATPRIVSRPAPPPDAIPVRWWILLPVCIVGVVLSDVLLYFGGRFFGDRLLDHRWLARVLPRDRRQRTERNFHRYGVSILIFGRLLPGIRSPLFLTAGTMRLPLPRFLLADAIGAVVGNSLFFFLGFWLGNQFEGLVGKAEEKLKPILIVTGIGLLVAYLMWHFLHHPVSTGDPQEVPLIGSQVASHMKPVEPSANHQSASEESAAKERPETKDSA